MGGQQDTTKKISVSIGGMTYQLVSRENETYTRDIARKADETIRQIMDQHPSLSSSQATILAMVNTLDALTRISDRFDEASMEMEKRTLRTANELENAKLETTKAKHDLFLLRDTDFELKKELLRVNELNRQLELEIAALRQQQDTLSDNRQAVETNLSFDFENDATDLNANRNMSTGQGEANAHEDASENDEMDMADEMVEIDEMNRVGDINKVSYISGIKDIEDINDIEDIEDIEDLEGLEGLEDINETDDINPAVDIHDENYINGLVSSNSDESNYTNDIDEFEPGEEKNMPDESGYLEFSEMTPEYLDFPDGLKTNETYDGNEHMQDLEEMACELLENGGNPFAVPRLSKKPEVNPENNFEGFRQPSLEDLFS